jgi:hypothetical protein
MGPRRMDVRSIHCCETTQRDRQPRVRVRDEPHVGGSTAKLKRCGQLGQSSELGLTHYESLSNRANPSNVMPTAL